MKFKPNLQLGMGLLLFSATSVIRRFINISDWLQWTLLLSALVFELWGVILISRSPNMSNSKLRQWKLRLTGKGEN